MCPKCCESQWTSHIHMLLPKSMTNFVCHFLTWKKNHACWISWFWNFIQKTRKTKEVLRPELDLWVWGCAVAFPKNFYSSLGKSQASYRIPVLSSCILFIWEETKPGDAKWLLLTLNSKITPSRGPIGMLDSELGLAEWKTIVLSLLFLKVYDLKIFFF